MISFLLKRKMFLAISRNDSSKTNIEQKQEQLNLALEWNRVDIVKNFIMKNERDWEVNRIFNLSIRKTSFCFFSSLED
jgi:hypothetical protein